MKPSENLKDLGVGILAVLFLMFPGYIIHCISPGHDPFIWQLFLGVVFLFLLLCLLVILAGLGHIVRGSK